MHSFRELEYDTGLPKSTLQRTFQKILTLIDMQMAKTCNRPLDREHMDEHRSVWLQGRFEYVFAVLDGLKVMG